MNRWGTKRGAWAIEALRIVDYLYQSVVQTFMVFMLVSASVLNLNTPLSTTVVVVVVGFLSTMVHFLVLASLTT